MLLSPLRETLPPGGWHGEVSRTLRVVNGKLLRSHHLVRAY